MKNVNQVRVYSLDTNAFLSDEEYEIVTERNNLKHAMKLHKEELMKIENKVADEGKTVSKEDIDKLLHKRNTIKNDEYHKHIINYYLFYIDADLEQQLFKMYLDGESKKKTGKLKNQLYKPARDRKKKLESMLSFHQEKRSVRRDTMIVTKEGKDIVKTKNVISLFESALTRTLEMKKDQLSTEIIIVRIYHYEVMESLIKDGFNVDNEEYIYLYSTAGMLRNRKCVFIKKSTWKKHEKTLMCGLTKDRINEKGINTNKFLSYLALQNSNSSQWKVDIDRVIVVPDFEFTVKNALVDYIDKDFNIIPQEMPIPMNIMDGAGLILPEKNKKTQTCKQIRLPFGKGLLIPCDFLTYAKKVNNTEIVDVWGKEWDIEKDDIRIILTASQLKLWSYYENWSEYKQAFKDYNCEASICNEEEESGDVYLNYQTVQTLIDIERSELEVIAQSTIDDITSIGSDKDTMLRVLGATEGNKNKSPYQEALLLYNELLNDEYSKKVIKNKKKSMVKDARSGKLRIEGKRVYILPDVYAFMQHLFGQEVTGLLKDGQVHTTSVREGKTSILRSPHLSKEHGLMENVSDSDMKTWFVSKGVYIPLLSMLPRLIQADFDGDQVTVVSSKSEKYLEVAERNMQGVNPLYYEMATAPKQELNDDNIITSLKAAFGVDIGTMSNNISKVFNSDKFDYDVVRFLCMISNFNIDKAKTNYSPIIPEHVEARIKEYTSLKLPYFFVDAKKKEEENVEKLNDSTVNMLQGIIPDKRINFKKVAGEFDYKNLKKVKSRKVDEKIVNKYVELDRKKKFMMNEETGTKSAVYDEIKRQLLEINNDENHVTDVLVEHLYKKKSVHKDTLWECFGEVILKNLKRNINGTKQCECCGTRIEVKSNAVKYCATCATKIKKQQDKENRTA